MEAVIYYQEKALKVQRGEVICLRSHSLESQQSWEGPV